MVINTEMHNWSNAKNKRPQSAHLQVDDLYNTSSSQVLENIEEASSKILGARGKGWLERNSIFKTPQVNCTCKLTVIVLVYTKAMPVQAKENPSMKTGGQQLQSEELLDTGLERCLSY